MNGMCPAELASVDAVTLLPLIDAALRGALVTVAGLLALALWQARSTHPVARTGLALMLGAIVQAFAAMPLIEAGVPIGWQAPLVGISIGNSVLFWLFTQALFDDDFALRPRHAAIWAAVVALGAGFCLSVAAFGPHAGLTVALVRLMRWVPAVFAVLALGGVAAQWRADLVERRRRLRGFILVAGVLYIGTMVVVRLVSPHGRLSAPSAGVRHSGAAADPGRRRGRGAAHPGRRGCCRPLPLRRRPAVTSASPAPGLPAAPASAAADAPPDAAEEALARALHALMSKERAYRIDDLTVGLLALKLGVPEYRLRRHINQRLGHPQLQRLRQRPAAGRSPRRTGRPGPSRGTGAGARHGGRFRVHRPLQPRLQGRHRADADGVPPPGPGRFLNSASRSWRLRPSARPAAGPPASWRHAGAGCPGRGARHVHDPTHLPALRHGAHRCRPAPAWA